MAAGMWQGLLAGYQDVEAKKAARAAKEEELLEKRKGLALQLAMKYGTGVGGGGGLSDAVGGAPSQAAGGQSLQHYSQVLRQQYGVSEEAIMKVAGTAGASGLGQAFEILEKQRLQYEEAGKELPKDVVSGIFDNAILTGPEDSTLDFSQLEEYIGAALDPLEKELIFRGRQTGGQAYFPSPAYVAPPKLQDVELMEQRATRAVTQAGEIEVRNLNNALNRVQQAETNTRDPQELAELESTKQWIIGRQVQVKDALESAKGEGGNPYGLVQLYGNEFFQDMFEADPRMSGGVLSPVFSDLQPAAPKRVDSMSTLRNLARAGLIKVGDSVEILDPVTGEYVTQIIGE
jgi:hypothetical protein